MLTDNILDLIGRTPLVRLEGQSILAKAGFPKPGGSIKARVALGMIEGAKRSLPVPPRQRRLAVGLKNRGLGKGVPVGG
jgi:cysteine synthase